MTATLPVRVMVQDAWDEVHLDLPSATSLAEMKRQALSATKVTGDPDGYVLKFRGAGQGPKVLIFAGKQGVAPPDVGV